VKSRLEGAANQITATAPATPVPVIGEGALKRILVVEPHPTLRTVLAQRLRQDGHLAAAVATAAEAIALCEEQTPDLLVSAELLDQSSALRLAAQLRTPVMVLTARTGAEPVVSLLDAGADDVLRKPFGLEELAARCRSLLRRSGSGLQERVSRRPPGSAFTAAPGDPAGSAGGAEPPGICPALCPADASWPGA
jgi:DNA-binding response OmpR family regulator